MGKINDQGTGLTRDQLLTIGDLEDFKFGLLNEINELIKERNGSPVKQWLRSSEVRKMLVYHRVHCRTSVSMEPLPIPKLVELSSIGMKT